MTGWVVDTCILDSCVPEKEEKGKGIDLDCVAFLVHHMDSQDSVILDNEGEILKQYKRKIKLYEPFNIVAAWFTHLTNKGLLYSVSGHLKEDYVESLRKMKFHDDDLVFVAVASNSISKKIVSTDSDFGCSPDPSKNRDDIRAFIREELSVLVYPPHEAYSLGTDKGK
jgi:hypothetical protein